MPPTLATSATLGTVLSSYLRNQSCSARSWDASCVPERSTSGFHEGQVVRVKCAGECEVEAIFLCDDGTERALILLNLLQREQRVRVPLSQLSAVGGNDGPIAGFRCRMF